MSKKKENIQTHFDKKERRGSWKKSIWLAVPVCAALLAGGLAAKYITSSSQQAETTSAQFHVTSNYLEEKTATYQITDWSDGFNIQLYNYEKENLALVSNEKISYEVEVEPKDKWKCEDPSSGKGEFVGNGTMQSNILVIKPEERTNINQNDTVTVTVNVTEPFTKTLSAKFTVASKKEPTNQLVQSSEDENQWHLIIGTNDYSGAVTVSWPNDKLCPDTTNKYMSTWMNNGSESLEVQKNTTYDLVFFSTQSDTTFRLSSQSGAAITIQ